MRCKLVPSLHSYPILRYFHIVLKLLNVRIRYCQNQKTNNRTILCQNLAILSFIFDLNDGAGMIFTWNLQSTPDNLSSPLVPPDHADSSPHRPTPQASHHRHLYRHRPCGICCTSILTRSLHSGLSLAGRRGWHRRPGHTRPSKNRRIARLAPPGPSKKTSNSCSNGFRP